MLCVAVAAPQQGSVITGSGEGNEPGFSRESFLQKLLELSPWRVKRQVLSQGTFSPV